MNINYPLNAWYAAAWDNDLGSAPLAREICGQAVVLYRGADRAPIALEDTCLHRLLPLSLGRVEGDNIVCGYHGMTFGRNGRCVRLPASGETVPPAARVRSYPVELRHRMVWLWPGDPALANPASIPDLHWADDPQWATEGGLLELDCDYLLVLDNLMDLTHETFVHASSIGHANLLEASFEVARRDGRVTLTRWMLDTEAPPFLAMQLRLRHGLGPEHVDRWQVIEFEGPSTIAIDVGVAKTGTGAPEGDRSQGVCGRVLNTLTPRSDGRCYYFFGFARNFALEDRALTLEIKRAQTNIFLEDKAVLEAQQRRIDGAPSRRMLDISIDKGSMWARGEIKRMISAETTQGTAG